jgi:hypothetical protein
MAGTDLLRSFPTEQVVDLVDDLLDSGNDRDDVIDAIVEFIDSLVRLDLWLPGPVGAVAEQVDGAVIRAAVSVLVAVAGDPTARAARRERRVERRANRRARRIARRAARATE